MKYANISKTPVLKNIWIAFRNKLHYFIHYCFIKIKESYK